MTSRTVDTPYLQISDSAPPIYLEADEITIGRESNCQITLPANMPGVSRRHAKIIRQQQNFAIVDLDSSNGTFVNGQKIEAEQILQSGDLIRLSAEGPGFTFVDPAVNVEITPTIVGARQTAPTLVVAPGNRSDSHSNAYRVPSAAPPPKRDHPLRWILQGSAVLVGGIVALLVGGRLLGNSLTQVDNPLGNAPSQPARAVPAAQPTGDTAPTNPTQSSATSPALAIDRAFICDTPQARQCTSDSAQFNPNSSIVFTLYYKRRLAPPTDVKLTVDYTSPQGQRQQLDLGEQQIQSPARIVSIPLRRPSRGWIPGTYQLNFTAQNAAGQSTRSQTFQIQ